MKKFLFFSVIVILLTDFNFAQCSDGGVCSIGAYSLENEKTPIQLSFGYSYGYSGKEDDISYNSINLGGSYSFLNNAKLSFELPFNLQSGPRGDVHGIGDLIFSINYQFELDKTYLTASAGMRLATASENSENVIQSYKSGLGSNDILLGLGYKFSNFLIGIGYQAAGKPPDNFLSVERGDDLLFRTSYNFDINDFSINPQLLFIKRLSKSKMYFINSDPAANTIPIYKEVDGTDQSQLNLLVNAKYHVNDNYYHFIEVAVPFLERDVNIDGLKRAFTISAGLSFGL